MFDTPNDGGDRHGVVVDHIGTVIQRRAVGTHDAAVVAVLGVEFHPPAHKVVDDDRLTVVVNPQPDGGTPPVGNKPRPFLWTQMPTAPRITVGPFLRLGLSAFGSELLGGAVTIVRGVASQ